MSSHLSKKKHKNKRTKKQRPETIHSRRIYAPRRSPTSIGPGDQSEEACLPVTTDRHQNRGDITNESRRDRATYTHRPRATWNKQQNAVTAGQPRTDARYTQMPVTAYTPYRGGFHPSLHSILVLYSFHLRELSTGAHVYKVQI